jgi:hypothetical protein
MVPDWIRHPKWKWLRPPAGVLLIVGGALGFLPVLGFWMIPLGVGVLAVDFPAAKRAEIWMANKWSGARARYRAWRDKR